MRPILSAMLIVIRAPLSPEFRLEHLVSRDHRPTLTALVVAGTWSDNLAQLPERSHGETGSFGIGGLELVGSHAWMLPRAATLILYGLAILLLLLVFALIAAGQPS